MLPVGSSSHWHWRKLPIRPSTILQPTLSFNYLRLRGVGGVVVVLILKELQVQHSHNRASLSAFVKELPFFFFKKMKHRATIKQLNKTTDKVT